MRNKIIVILAVLIVLMSGCAEKPVSMHNIKTCLYYYGDELTDLDNETAFKIASSYDLLILTETNSNPEIINKIKKLNPDAKIIVYTNSVQLVNTHNKIIKENNIYPSMQEIFDMAEREHKDWFLLDKNGEFTYAAHPYLESEYYKDFIPYLDMWVFMDPTSGWAEYYVEYAKNMATLYDGVYSDVGINYEELVEMINTDEWSHPINEDQWNNAMVKMFNKVHDTIGEDKITIYNNGYNCWVAAGAYDGRLLEWWMQLDMAEPVGSDYWELHMDSAKETIESGGILCAVQYGTTEEHRIYGLASLLLIANDKTYYFFDEGGVDTESKLAWYPEYEVNIGETLTNYYKRGNIYQRDFSNGKVLVNPYEKSINIKLDKTYRTLDGKIVTEITLKPKTGIILLGEL